jgi:hypothetical protein
MNWDAIGAIGELAGALAVVITLLFLARQLRLSNRQQRLESGRAVTEEFNRINTLFLDLDKMGMIIRALHNWQAAMPQEQHIMSMYFMIYVQHMQGLHGMWVNDAIDDSLYLAEEGSLMSMLANPGAQVWWELFHGMYTDEFVFRINSLNESNTYQPMVDALPFWEASAWPREL